MSGRAIVGAIVAAAALAFSLRPVSVPAASPSLSFTGAQAGAGAEAYAQRCASCHGAKLEGYTGPALGGAGSMIAAEAIGQVYTFMSSQMPADKPGSLSSATYVAILAYLLRSNGHPAGTSPLTAATARQSTTLFGH